jgi:prolipoprotein diacylglyceryltransferase
MWSYRYPHNVNEMDPQVLIPGCEGKYCNQLEFGVYPTPFYEVIACFILFLILWSLRKRFTVPGTLFGFYLMLNGFERFFIEKIRVNTRLNIFGFQPTQAEVISSLLFVAGLVIWIVLKRRANRAKLNPQ